MPGYLHLVLRGLPNRREARNDKQKFTLQHFDSKHVENQVKEYVKYKVCLSLPASPPSPPFFFSKV